ncbi:unnamed protein product [Prorocentrum cordatum]|uniref:AP2/ERF domain-containing protein n=1 Tax=Prorocentrum cordatum TaxID=2364126 RepID=A0ABN9U8C0_9DINO|nr:unnamed protein product [Polarella glacialis]
MEEEDRLGQARAGSYSPAEGQSGVKHINWVNRKAAWRITYKIRNGPDQGRKKQLAFRPKDESPEEVEQARLAAVEALRRLEEEDRALAPRQSGVKYIHWVSKKQTWCVRYLMKNGPDKGTRKQPTFRPKDGSPEEVERARLAAVQALRGLQEGDRALAPTSSGLHKAERQSGVQHIDWDRATQACGSPPSQALQQLEEEGHALEPSCSGRPCANRGRGEVPLLDGLFLVVGEDV